MKYVFSLCVLSLVLMTSCSYTRIGDLNMVSNRNIDMAAKHKLVQREGMGVVKMSEKDPLETCIDKITTHYQGDYLMNVRIYMRKDGKKIKVEGDVWVQE